MERFKLSEKDKFHLLSRAQFIKCDGRVFCPCFWAEPDVKITFKTSAFGRGGIAKVSIIYKYYDYEIEVGCVYDRHDLVFDFKYITLEKVFGPSQTLRIDETMTVVGSLHRSFDFLLYNIFGSEIKEVVTPKLHSVCVEDSEEGEGVAVGQGSVCPAGESGDSPLPNENKHSVATQTFL